MAATTVRVMVVGSLLSNSQNSGKAKAMLNRQLAVNMARRPIRSDSQPEQRDGEQRHEGGEEQRVQDDAPRQAQPPGGVGDDEYAGDAGVGDFRDLQPDGDQQRLAVMRQDLHQRDAGDLVGQLDPFEGRGFPSASGG